MVARLNMTNRNSVCGGVFSRTEGEMLIIHRSGFCSGVVLR